MRLKRIERGALTLASAEVKFQIDTETHDPLDIGRLFIDGLVQWPVDSLEACNIFFVLLHLVFTKNLM